jgi:hypothetical protein
MSRTLPAFVTKPVMEQIYSKVVDVKEMQRLEEQIPKIMCQLEMIFSPAFFDIMVHLTVQLATEVRYAGPM